MRLRTAAQALIRAAVPQWFSKHEASAATASTLTIVARAEKSCKRRAWARPRSAWQRFLLAKLLEASAPSLDHLEEVFAE